MAVNMKIEHAQTAESESQSTLNPKEGAQAADNQPSVGRDALPRVRGESPASDNELVEGEDIALSRMRDPRTAQRSVPTPEAADNQPSVGRDALPRVRGESPASDNELVEGEDIALSRMRDPRTAQRSVPTPEASAAPEPPPENPSPSFKPSDALLRKPRSDAEWNKLSGDQRALLEEWLFEERISYRRALDRAKKDFGFEGSLSSIARFYKRIAEARAINGLCSANELAAAVDQADVDVPRMCGAAMKLVSQLFLQQVATQPDQPKRWGFLAQILLRYQATESREALKREENEIRDGHLALAREKWADILRQRAKVEEAERKRAEAEAIEKELARRKEAPSQHSTDRYECNKWSNQVRYNLFGALGADLDHWKPESAAEEEAMEAVESLPPQTAREEKQRIAAEIYQNARQREIDRKRQEMEEERQVRELLRRDVRAEAERKRAEEQREAGEAEQRAKEEQEQQQQEQQQEESDPVKAALKRKGWISEEDLPKPPSRKTESKPKHYLVPIWQPPQLW